MKPTGLPSCLERLDPRLAARRDEVIGVARQADARKLLLDGVGGSRRVGEQDHAAALLAPLLQALRRARDRADAVVNDAPDVAQDQPVFGVQPVPKVHSSPASASACSIGVDVLRIVELAQRERRRLHVDHRNWNPGDEEAQLLEAFEGLQLAHRRRDIALERFGPVGIDADMQPDGRHFAVERALGQMRDSRFEK